MSKFCYVCMEQYDESQTVCPVCGSPDYSTPLFETHLVPGYMLYGRYIIGRALGSGGFGITYIAWDDLLQQKVAIKEYLPPNFATRNHGNTHVSIFSGENFARFNNGLHRFLNEARRLARNNDVDGIVRIMDCFEENDTAYIVMEYVEGPTLETLLKHKENGRFEPDEALRIILPLIRAVEEVHQNGIYHRDIAPDNIILNPNGKAVLIDFGSAKSELSPMGGHSSTVIIKAGYSPEEQYSSQAEFGSYTDVYALAGTLYKMLTGVTPPAAPDRRNALSNKQKDPLKPVSAYCPKINPRIEQAIMHAMVLEASRRTHTMAEFYRELISTGPAPKPVRRSKKIPIILTAAVIALGGIGAGVFAWGSGIKDVQVKQWPDKMDYRVNESFNEEGLFLEVTNRFGQTTVIESGYECSAETFTEAGETDVMVSYKGKTVPITVNVSANDYSRLEIISQPEQRQFLVNETIKADGIKLAAHYAEGDGFDLLDNPEDLVISPEKFDQPGEQTVTVTYGGVSTTYTVEIIGHKMESLGIEQLPHKISYKAGEKLNADGLTLLATYGDGSTEVIAEGYTVQDISLDKPGKTSVKVTYNGFEAFFDVDVAAVEETAEDIIDEPAIEAIWLKGLRIDSKPNKTEYTVGEKLDLTGLKISAVYSDNSMKLLSQDEYSCSPLTLNTVGTQVITVKYENMTKTFEVSVKAKAEEVIPEVKPAIPIYLNAISIKSKPSKLEYTVGDTLNTSGLILNAHYSNGVTEFISKNFTCSPTKLNTAGTQTITVTYYGKTTTFTVNVKNKAAVTLSSISIKTKPNKLTYDLDNSLNTAGLTLNAKYSDGTTKTISANDVTCSPTKLSTPGKQIITVKYGGKSTTFEVTVKGDRVAEILSISVAAPPDKTTYVVGQTFDSTGMKILVTYSDDNGNYTNIISKGFTCSPTKLDKPGRKTITITYEGFTCEYSVQVKENSLESISVANLPYNTHYIVGEMLNRLGLTLNLHYTDGSVKIADSGYTTSYDNTPLNQEGTVTVSVYYKGLQTEFEVNVAAEVITIQSVVIDTLPRTRYAVGERFDPSGMTLLITYSNGTTETVSSGYSYNVDFLLTNGIQTIEIFYQYFTIPLEIIVGFR